MSGQKKDNIYIYGGSFKKIDGGGGADKISVSKKAKGGASSDDTATIYGGAGGDTITVSVGTNYNISGDAGADTIRINAGNKHNVNPNRKKPVTGAVTSHRFISMGPSFPAKVREEVSNAM